jgi:hypothetical protein
LGLKLPSKEQTENIFLDAMDAGVVVLILILSLFILLIVNLGHFGRLLDMPVENICLRVAMVSFWQDVMDVSQEIPTNLFFFVILFLMTHGLNGMLIKLTYQGSVPELFKPTMVGF